MLDLGLRHNVTSLDANTSPSVKECIWHLPTLLDKRTRQTP